jgi:hypothetical protein
VFRNDGKQYQTKYYNLDVIISAGYRVKSHRDTQFRIWATQRLKEYIVKGFALDDERLKKGGGDHFDELLDDFLRVNDRQIMRGFGKVTAQLAKELADQQFEKFDHHRRALEDAQAAEEFAKEVAELEKKAKRVAQPADNPEND